MTEQPNLYLDFTRPRGGRAPERGYVDGDGREIARFQGGRPKPGGGEPEEIELVVVPLGDAAAGAQDVALSREAQGSKRVVSESVADQSRSPANAPRDFLAGIEQGIARQTGTPAGEVPRLAASMKAVQVRRDLERRPRPDTERDYAWLKSKLEVQPKRLAGEGPDYMYGDLRWS